jgi:hypothetical protein
MFTGVRGETSRDGSVRAWRQEDEKRLQQNVSEGGREFTLEEVFPKRGKDRPIKRDPRNRVGPMGK